MWVASPHGTWDKKESAAVKKLLLGLGAVAVAAAFGFLIGRRSPEPAPGVAWAQRFLGDPSVAGRVVVGDDVLEGVVGVQGLEEACSVVEQKVIGGDGQEEVIKFPGLIAYKNLSVSIALHKVEGSTLHKWFEMTHIEGEFERKNGSVIFFDRESGEEVRRYDFFEAWPCKWHVPEVSHETGGMAVEKIEIAVEKVERAR